MGDPTTGRGRKLLVDPRFQISCLLFTGFLALGAVGSFFLADQAFLNHLAREGLALGLPTTGPFLRLLADQRLYVDEVYAGTALAVIAFMCLGGLVLSHRVARPLQKLKNHFSSVADGLTLDDVSFRKGDYFQDVAEAYNRQMAKYRENVGAQAGGRGSATVESPRKKAA